MVFVFVFFFQAEGGIRDADVTGVQTCALPISAGGRTLRRRQPGRRLRDDLPERRPHAEPRPLEDPAWCLHSSARPRELIRPPDPQGPARVPRALWIIRATSAARGRSRPPGATARRSILPASAPVCPALRGPRFVIRPSLR